MSTNDRRRIRSHYDDDGMRVRSNEPHSKHLEEKHLKNALRGRHFEELFEDVDESVDPYWLFKDE